MNYIVSSGKTSSGIILNGSDSMTVLDGGIATATTADGGGLTVSSGGATNDTTVNGSRLEDKMSSVRGSMTVDGGVAINTLLLLGNMTVSKSGIANGVTVSAALWKNGNTWIHAERCTLRVLDGGVVNDATADWGEIFVASGGEANRVVVSGYRTDNNSVDAGHVTLLDGGVIHDAEIGDGGQLYVSGGVVNRTTVTGGGDLRIFSNGTASDVTVSAAGRRVYVFGGGKLTGRISIASNASVSAYGGAILDFDISDLAPGAEARINDLSRIYMMPDTVFTLTVAETPLTGTYSLANGASRFNSSISVQNTSGVQLRTLSVGQAAIIGGLAYTLRLDGGVLGLEIRTDIVAPTVTNVTQNTLEPAKSVTVTAIFADDVELAQSLYRIGETGEWTAYDNGVTVTENTTVYFKAVDAAGNESEVAAYEVSNIDKVKPTVSGVTPSTLEPAKHVTVTAAFTDDVELAQSLYRIGETGEWLDYVDGVTVTDNTTIYFKAIDTSDNESEVASIMITNIDKVKPSVSGITPSTLEPAKSVTITAVFADDVELAQSLYRVGETGEWTAYDNGVTVTENTTVYFKAVDAAGNESEVASYEVANINKTPGVFSGLVLTEGYTIVSSGQVYTETTLDTLSDDPYYDYDDKHNCFIVCSGGTATDTTINDFSSLCVLSGGTAENTNAYYGKVMIFSGGVADHTVVSNSKEVYYEDEDFRLAELYVFSGGVTDHVVVSGGSLTVSSGGTATDIVWTPCEGHISIQEGAHVTFAEEYSGVYYGSGFQLLSQAAFMTGKKVDSLCEMNVMSGGTANNTTVDYGGRIAVSSDGRMNNTILHGGLVWISGGGVVDNTIVLNSSEDIFAAQFHSTGYTLFVLSGGTADHTTLLQGGALVVYSGGTADHVVVAPGGCLFVSGGGTATDIVWTPCEGHISIQEGAHVTFAEELSGVYYGSGFQLLSQAAFMTGKKVDSFCEMNVMSGGTAYGTEVAYTGSMTVYSGGSVNSVTIEGASHYSWDGGWLYVYSGGTASNIDASAKGAIVTFDVAPETYVQGASGDSSFEMKNGILCGYILNGGDVNVLSGGTANSTTVNSDGYLEVYSGGTANNTIVNSDGYLGVFSGGTANNTIVNSDGYLEVYSGGTANNTIVNSDGYLGVYSGGTANDVSVVFGRYTYVVIGYGAVISNISVNTAADDMCFDYVDCYGRITGRITILNGTIRANPGSILDFDLTRTSAGAAALLNDLSKVEGAPTYTLTVSGSQEHGTYALAEGAADFNGTITVVNASGTELGTLSVGTSATISDVDYALSLSDGILSLQVTSGGASSGGTPSEIISGLVLEDETLSVESGQAYLDTEIREGAALIVSGGGIAENTMVCTDAKLTVLSGGTATETTVAEDGRLTVSGGGTAEHVVVSGGSLTVSSGGTATDIVWTPCEGTVIIETGAVATFTEEHSGVYLGTYGELVSHAAVMTGKQIYDSMCVMSGGTAVDTTACDGSMFVFSGGVANDTVLADGEDYARGRMYVFGGGTAAGTVVSGGYLGVSGGTAAGTVVLKGLVEVKDGGTANDTVVSRTLEEWDSYDGEGGSRTEYGSMYVSGGVANGVSVSDGVLIVGSGGTAADVFVNNESSYGGRIESSFSDEFGPSYRYNPGVHVSAGGRLTGRITLNDRAKVYADNGAVLDFDLTRTSAGAAALLNDLSGIEGVPVYTLTVDGSEEYGVYALADGVSAFYSVITVVNDSGAQLGSLAPGNTITVGQSDYTLNLADGSLTVTVVASEAIPPDEDTTAPSAPSALMSYVIDRNVILTWNASTDDTGVKEYIVTYSLDGQVFTARTNNSHYLLDNAGLGSYGWSIRAVDFAGNESGVAAGDAFTVSGFKPYTVEYSPDDFRHAIRFSVTTPELDLFRMPNDTCRLRVRQEGDNEWLAGDPIVAAEFDGTPQLVISDADGNMDVFFANGVDTWESGYLAQHVGSVNDWAGTNEYAAVFGKNKLTDIIEGSADANILLMTDDPNGDTLFVEDIYSDSPDGLGLSRSRIARIDEIRAGAGDDVVDMTSRQFEYIGSGLTIRGGEGNDVIWANKGGNRLFGDAGNDRIVGASGNDVIAGGIGNDRMHGGGGDDVFTFCDNWGADNVEQLETGSVTLWFASGDKAKWDAGTLTYTDGENSVRVSGVAADRITLKFGDDGSDRFAALASAGAFFDATTERIFEESGKGILAGV